MNNIDLFRFLTEGSNSFTIETIAFNMSMTTVIALFIFLIYKKTFNGVLYSQNFNVTLVIVAMTTSMVIMLIGSNLAISLGMVGALSIVRFRSVIKEPRDLAFLFWAIAVGLASGTGAFLIAGIGSVFIALMMILFSRAAYRDYCYLLVLRGETINTDEVVKIFIAYGIKHKLRMKNVNGNCSEVTYEVYLKKMKVEKVVEYFKFFPAIREVNIVSFSGEITG